MCVYVFVCVCVASRSEPGSSLNPLTPEVGARELLLEERLTCDCNILRIQISLPAGAVPGTLQPVTYTHARIHTQKYRHILRRGAFDRRILAFDFSLNFQRLPTHALSLPSSSFDPGACSRFSFSCLLDQEKKSEGGRRRMKKESLQGIKRSRARNSASKHHFLQDRFY